jgi:carbon-monoxide dehydrogenase medium subunit
MTVDKEGLHVGAMATHAMIMQSEIVRRKFPALAEAAATMAAVQVRNLGTIGGNFCSAVPSADLPPICIAGSAKVRLVGRRSERLVPVEDFFVGPRRTTRKRDELMVEILIPPAAWASGTGARYEKFGLRGASALAVAGAAAWVRLRGETVTECRIALGAVHPTPLLAADASASVVGRPLSKKAISEAADLASRECSPITDLRGSADYRRELVRVLTAAALEEAGKRAGSRRKGKTKGKKR